MKIAFYTLGCKVNQYETQAMEHLARQRGHTPVPFGDEADACVINSCAVTAEGDRKSRQALRRARKLHPHALLALCGCYAQTHPEEAWALGADLVAGTGGRAAFLALLEEAAAERRYREEIDRPFERRVFEELPAGGLESRTRAMLKVEDGCANFCSYCIIPYARGRVRSLARGAAEAQTRALAEAGYREIVLTGIELSSWGGDLRTGETLIDLVEGVCRAAPEVRIRLGSLEPRTVTEGFCRRAAALPNLCPQFHLSLQSGCDETLRRMNRRYDTARYLQSVTLLRRAFDRPALTTDLITGFPEETEEEFAQTLRFLERCAFARVHVFPYSVRPGTPAAERPQCPSAVRAERAERAAEVAAATRRAYLEGCVGQVYPVLFEQRAADGLFSGHAPNYMEVRAPGENLHNVIQPVHIFRTDGDLLFGALEEPL